MPYVYKITNQINGKVYIGQTRRTVKERMDEHYRDYTTERYWDKPLYIAMRKYGIQNFSVETIEETDEPETREMFWVEQYRSFKNGYNATMGGKGKRYIDYDVVIETYRHIKSIEKTANLLGIDAGQVSTILSLNGEYMLNSIERAELKLSTVVNMLSKDGEYIKTFSSYHDAARYLIEQGLTNCKLETIRTHISEACRGKRKSAAGFAWQSIAA